MGDKPEKIDAPPPCHNVAKVAEDGFGKNAEAYDKHRPSYTEQVVDLVLEEITNSCQGSSGNDIKYEVLELGAGTGKLTGLIAPKLPSGFRYLATEPSRNFLDLLKAKSLPIDTSNISASSIPLSDNSVQTILCGQCLHWFANEVSLREIHRVIAPGGKLIAVWNLKKFEETPWTMEIYNQRLEVMKKTQSSTMTWVNSMEWKKSLESLGIFTCSREESLPGIHYQGDLDSMVDHMRTISCYNALPPEECQAYIDALKKVIRSYPDVNPDNMIFPFRSLLCVYQPV